MLLISSSFIMHICSNYLLLCSRVAQNKWLQTLLIQFCSFCGLLERFFFWPYLGCLCGSFHLAHGQTLAECIGFPVCCFSTWLVCATSNNGGLRWWDFLHSSWLSLEQKWPLPGHLMARHHLCHSIMAAANHKACLDPREGETDSTHFTFFAVIHTYWWENHKEFTATFIPGWSTVQSVKFCNRDYVLMSKRQSLLIHWIYELGPMKKEKAMGMY